MVFRGFSRRLASRRPFPISAPLRRHFSSKALLKIGCEWNYLRPIHHIEVHCLNLDELTMRRDAFPKLLNSAQKNRLYSRLIDDNRAVIGKENRFFNCGIKLEHKRLPVLRV